MMFAEEIATNVNWTLLCGFIMAACTALMWWDSRKSRVTQIQQPVSITITEELHKVFAAKEDFDKHVAANEIQHRDLFSKIGGVDRGNAGKISAEVTAIHNRINAIEKSSGRLEASTEIQSQQLAQMDAKITRLLERNHES